MCNFLEKRMQKDCNCKAYWCTATEPDKKVMTPHTCRIDYQSCMIYGEVTDSPPED